MQNTDVKTSRVEKLVLASVTLNEVAEARFVAHVEAVR